MFLILRWTNFGDVSFSLLLTNFHVKGTIGEKVSLVAHLCKPFSLAGALNKSNIASWWPIPLSKKMLKIVSQRCDHSWTEYGRSHRTVGDPEGSRAWMSPNSSVAIATAGALIEQKLRSPYQIISRSLRHMSRRQDIATHLLWMSS